MDREFLLIFEVLEEFLYTVDPCSSGLKCEK
jgi:hypothetical protein